MKLPLIDQAWHAVGTCVYAGAADPASAAMVCACELGNGVRLSPEEAAALAGHIAKVHNTDLARRVVERQMGVRD